MRKIGEIVPERAVPKQKQCSVVDVSGGKSKVQWYKEQCIYRILFLNKCAVCARSLSGVQLFVTPWTVTCQAPLSMDSSSKNTGVGCHFLLQGIFLIKGSNPRLLYWQEGSLALRHLRQTITYLPICYWWIFMMHPFYTFKTAKIIFVYIFVYLNIISIT